MRLSVHPDPPRALAVHSDLAVPVSLAADATVVVDEEPAP
jgi:hypothetical protein